MYAQALTQILAQAPALAGRALELNEIISNERQLSNLKQANQKIEIDTLRIQAQLKKDPNAEIASEQDR